MKTKNYLSGHFSYKTDLGLARISNDDRVIGLNNSKGNVLLVVCDGMGGAKKGDFAATIAITTVQESFKNRKRGFLNRGAARYWLASAIRKANRRIYNEASKNEEMYKGMGTTITALLIVRDYYVVAQVGDSRCYTISPRNNQFIQITEDQTYVAYLYRTKAITEEEMATHPKRHVLMNALGIYPSLELDIKTGPYLNEPFLLCTDGLYNNVSKQDIELIFRGEDTVEQKISTLIALANANGGSDNIGIVLWESDN
ncbi:MAG: Stp1/IreP family PP2C-type Ser/Thr phosphatase [Bacilli bacterium]|nr:Stp1/IreP family PP2C-type Ser/Thr phosphatase [Bacilli bacterium]